MMKGKNTALLIIDIQLGSFLEKFPLYNSDGLLNNIQAIITNAHSKQIPVFMTKHNGKKRSSTQKGSAGWEIHPSLQLTGTEIIIEKDNPDAFQQTDLEQQLTFREIGRIIIAGIRSDICIDATCRQAYSKSYEVIIAKDGHSTYNTGLLKAKQIIDHHNEIFEAWFADVIQTSEMELYF